MIATTVIFLNSGMVSQSIASKGGPGIQAQLSLTAGNDFRVTSGGNLPCKHIYHIVANSEHDIKTLLVKLLGSAEKNEQIASVSIPALGTGNNELEVRRELNIRY